MIIQTWIMTVLLKQPINIALTIMAISIAINVIPTILALANLNPVPPQVTNIAAAAGVAIF